MEVVLLALKAMFDLQDLSPSVKQELSTLVQVSEHVVSFKSVECSLNQVHSYATQEPQIVQFLSRGLTSSSRELVEIALHFIRQPALFVDFPTIP